MGSEMLIWPLDYAFSDVKNRLCDLCPAEVYAKDHARKQTALADVKLHNNQGFVCYEHFVNVEPRLTRSNP